MTDTATLLKPRERNLSIRLARDADDLVLVQRLRARVFFTDYGADQEPLCADMLDGDCFDPLCDHLLVVDREQSGEEQVVGTYRLLRESVARSGFGLGFYSEAEFDLDAICRGPARPAGELLELGRSCVLPEWRTSATISLLWRGIADYLARHRIGLMFGCASFVGTEPDRHAAALSYLYHNHLADPQLRPKVIDGRGAAMERLPRGSYDERQAVLQLPPLVKGYLRAGAAFGEGAFIDRDFNSIDVCVVMPVERITSRYAARFNVSS